MHPSRLLPALALLAACGSAPPVIVEQRDGPPTGSVSIPDLPGSPVPRPEPRSRYGNSPEYEVLGKRYRVMDSANGYREVGVASWYGKKFHGRLTANRETYNMYAMSAAHTRLPLPTYVRVRNLANDKSVIVRVNDRGPFAHDRIIDLSYAAAMKLDMLTSGTAQVEVTAITFDEPTGDRPTSVRNSGQARDFIVPDDNSPVYLQAGAFGSRENAERLRAQLAANQVSSTFIVTDRSASTTLYRVRIGPVANVAHYEKLERALQSAGIEGAYLVSD